MGKIWRPIFALSSEWEEKLLMSSMAHRTAEAFHIVRCLDHSGKLDDFPQDKKQKAATASLRDKQHEQDFAGPLYVLLEFLDQSVAFALRKFCST